MLVQKSGRQSKKIYCASSRFGGGSCGSSSHRITVPHMRKKPKAPPICSTEIGT